MLLAEPAESGLSNALNGLGKGETGSLCFVLRYCLSASRFRYLTTHLRKQGYVLTLGAEARYLETILKIALTELSCQTKISLEDLLASGNGEKKRIFVLEFLNNCARKNEELEKEALCQIKPLNGRRRSYSAGSEQMVKNMSPIPRHPKGDDEPVPELRMTLNPPPSRQNFIEPWVNSTSAANGGVVSAAAAAGIYPIVSPRTQYFQRSTPAAAMTPYALSNGNNNHVSSNSNHDGESSSNNNMTPMTAGVVQHSRTIPSASSSNNIHFGEEGDQANRESNSAASRTGPGSFNGGGGSSLHHQVKQMNGHGRVITIQTQEEDGLLHQIASTKPCSKVEAGPSLGQPLTMSPRERLMSPHRKSPSIPSPASAPVGAMAHSRRVRRLELDEDLQASSFSGPQPRASPVELTSHQSDFGERLSRLEVRLDTEFASINERFGRLERALNDLTKLLISQNKPNGKRDDESE